MTVASDTSARQGRPAYGVPQLRLIFWAIDLLLGRRRSFARDGELVAAHNRRLPRYVEGVELAPAEGSFILVMNHFSRRGLRPFHCAMLVSAALARRRPGQPEPRWAFTSEYVDVKAGPVRIPPALTRWLFRRIANTYGFVTIARREELVMGRAAALRDLARTLSEAPIALTPEGLDTTGPLEEPRPGTGLFLATLARRGHPFLPVGLWEEDSAFCIRFGAPFHLELAPGLSREDEDRETSARIMLAIGRLLPPSYHGAYAEALSTESVGGAP